MNNRSWLPWYIAALLFILLLILIRVGWWRSSSVGAQVQVPMFYDAHYLFPRAWTQEQAAPGVPEPAPLAVYGSNRISQKFIGGSDRLAMIEVWLYGQANELVAVSLVDNHGRAVGGDITLDESRERTRYRLEFEPYTNSQGDEFTLTMTAPNASVENPVVTRTVGGDRLDGALRINEYNRPGNLELRTYANGWPGSWWFEAISEQILPSVFLLRLRQYKPEIFKGAFFPILALITFGLSILFLVLAAPQAADHRARTGTLVGWSVVLIMASFLVWQIAGGRLIVKPLARNVFLNETDELISLAPAPSSGSRLANDLVAELWTAERYPEARFVNTALIAGYPGIQVPADSRLEFNIHVPPGAHFHTGVAGEGQGELEAVIRVGDTTIQSTTVTAVSAPGTSDIQWMEVDLEPWAGTPITLILETEGQASEAAGWWIMPQVVSTSDWVLDDPLPPETEYEVASYIFNNLVELTGYRVGPETVRGGDILAVHLFWRPLAEIDSYGKIFVHLLDAQGNLVAQDDGQPVNESYPLPVWQMGTIVADTHSLQLPEDLAEGSYQLAIGLYDPDSLDRWVVQDANGQKLTDRRVILTTPVEVAP